LSLSQYVYAYPPMAHSRTSMGCRSLGTPRPLDSAQGSYPPGGTLDVHSAKPSVSGNAQLLASTLRDVVWGVGGGQRHGTLLVGIAHEYLSPRL